MIINRQTSEAHNLSWDLFVTALTAENLATDTTVMTATKCMKATIALITLMAVAVRHPILFEITVFVALRGL